MTSKQKAKELTKQGYRVVSLKHRTVSRIADERWRDMGYDADFYRRCISDDQLIISASVLKEMKTSCHDKVGYIEL